MPDIAPDVMLVLLVPVGIIALVAVRGSRRRFAERITYPSGPGIVVAFVLLLVPFVWPLAVFMMLRYVTGHRYGAEASPRGQVPALSVPAASPTGRPIRLDHLPVRGVLVSAAVVVGTVTLVVMSWQPGVPASEAVVLESAIDPTSCRLLNASRPSEERTDCRFTVEAIPAQPGVAAGFDVEAVNVAAAVGAAVGTFLLLSVLILAWRGLGAGERRASDLPTGSKRAE